MPDLNSDQFRYTPDPHASDEGEFIFPHEPQGPLGDKGIPRWHQSHQALVRSAMQSLKGDYVDMHIHMGDEEEGAPIPRSGSGRKMRAQAGALLHELASAGQPVPKLFRGSHVEPEGVRAWSEREAVARRWAKKRPEGRVHRLPAASTTGLKVSHYINNNLDQDEREWVVHHPRKK